MKTRILAGIITGIFITSAAQAEMVSSTSDPDVSSTNNLDVIYSGMNPNFIPDADVSRYYTVSAQLKGGAEQAETVSVSTKDMDVIYSGMSPNFIPDADVSRYYTVSAQLKMGAEQASTCRWRVVTSDIAPMAAYTIPGNQEYFAPVNVQLLC